MRILLIVLSVLLISACVGIKGDGLNGYSEKNKFAGSNEVNKKSNQTFYNYDNISVKRLDVLIAPKELLNIFNKITPIDGKYEFETIEGFYTRKYIAEDDPRLKQSFVVISDWTCNNSIVYDADQRRFIVSVTNIPVETYIEQPEHHSEGLHKSLDKNKFFAELSQKKQDFGFYTGMNAFGVTRQVAKTKYYSLCLRSLNTYDLLGSKKFFRENDIFKTKINFKTKIVSPDIAVKIKKDLAIAYEVSPRLSRIQPDKFGIIEESSDRLSPTIDMPIDTKTEYLILNVKMLTVYLVNTKTKEVYSMIPIK